jgi:GNAT superfamily N-acetyltransferase
MDSESGAPTTHDLPAGVAFNNQNTLCIQFSTVKNAGAFGSVFTTSSVFDLQDTRLNPTSRRTMIVATNQIDGPNDNQEGPEWLGTLSILSPASLSERPRDKPLPQHILDPVKNGEVEIYIIIGVWVNPEYRRRGIGRLLVDHALGIIRLQPGPNTNIPVLMDNSFGAGASRGGTQNWKQKRLVMLNVRENNDIARVMYEKIGFLKESNSNEGTDSQGFGSDWMSLYISD